MDGLQKNNGKAEIAEIEFQKEIVPRKIRMKKPPRSYFLATNQCLNKC